MNEGSDHEVVAHPKMSQDNIHISVKTIITFTVIHNQN